jgi:hypothetical protein
MNVAVYAACVGAQLLAVGKQVVCDDVKQYCFVAESMVALAGHGIAMVQSWLLHSCCCESVSGTGYSNRILLHTHRHITDTASRKSANFKIFNLWPTHNSRSYQSNHMV